MVNLPPKLTDESESEYNLFIKYLSPNSSPLASRSIEKVAKMTLGEDAEIRMIAERNLWRKRALEYDVELIKDKQSSVTLPPEKLVASAFLKLAGAAISGKTPPPNTDDETLRRALKLIDGYRKLK